MWLLMTQLVFANPSDANPHGVADPHASVDPHQASAAETRSGVVVQTMDSGGYTYAEIEADGTRYWIAGPLIQLAPGDSIITTQGNEMRDFHSRTLDRTFEAITFVAKLEKSGAHATDAATTLGAGVTPLDGGSTIAALYADKANLNETEVALRAVVVKVTPNIRGKNFIHVQDGTGAKGDGTHDLPVTTTDSVNVGDTVVLRGVLKADHDLGAGYHYAALLEASSATVE